MATTEHSCAAAVGGLSRWRDGFILGRRAAMAEADSALRERQPWKAANERDWSGPSRDRDWGPSRRSWGSGLGRRPRAGVLACESPATWMRLARRVVRTRSATGGPPTTSATEPPTRVTPRRTRSRTPSSPGPTSVTPVRSTTTRVRPSLIPAMTPRSTSRDSWRPTAHRRRRPACHGRRSSARARTWSCFGPLAVSDEAVDHEDVQRERRGGQNGETVGLRRGFGGVWLHDRSRPSRIGMLIVASSGGRDVPCGRHSSGR
jgi:hypothetical protein